MTSRSLIILGATGDLTTRLLLPALDGVLAGLESEGEEVEVELIGAGHDADAGAGWVDTVRSSLSSGPLRDHVISTTRFEVVDATSSSDLAQVLASAAHPPILYFALPPAVTERAVDALSTVELPPGTRLALEKPFARDAASAAALNERLDALVSESRIHRIDHFLAKSTVVNLLGLRFANHVFEALWSAEHVASIEIVYDETLALEGRAGYYDRAGALVDMIQSHLLLVHALVVMEQPASLAADDLHDAMVASLIATGPINGDPVAASRRARYTTGTIDGQEIADYVSEPDVEASRGTETLAEVTVEVDTPRWRGVPITLRSGKAIGRPATEIRMTLRPVTDRLEGLIGDPMPATIRLALSPEHLSIDLDINGAGDPFDLDRVTLETDFGEGQLSAYGEVLAGILSGDDTLSVRGDLAEQCWRIVDAVLEAWRAGHVPLDEYAAGSDGPTTWTSRGAAD